MAGETIILPDGTTTVLPGAGDNPWDTELNGTVKALNTATKNKIAAAGGLSGAPAYAQGLGLVNSFDPRLSVYNWKASNTRKLRTALGKAAAGTGLANLAVIGDSLSTGYDGNGNTIDAHSWPRVMTADLASRLGTVVAGTGCVPATADTASRLSDRWTTTGGVVGGGGPFLVAYGSAGTATYVSQQTGTMVQLFWLDNGYGPITWTVDGAAQPSITVGSLHTVRAATVTGLANTVHTVVVTLPNYGSIAGLLVGGQTSGIAMSNLAFGGAGAVFGGALSSWTDTSIYYNLPGCRFGMLAASVGDPDFVFLELGSNDINNGVTASTIMAAHSTLRAKYPNAGTALFHGWDIPSDPHAADFDGYTGAKYQLADTLDIPLIDWNDRIGGQAVADAGGALGPDHTHPTAGTGVAFGHAMAQLCAS